VNGNGLTREHLVNRSVSSATVTSR
jgi:hypothetical protein